jgi:hypothetical protein
VQAELSLHVMWKASLYIDGKIEKSQWDRQRGLTQGYVVIELYRALHAWTVLPVTHVDGLQDYRQEKTI